MCGNKREKSGMSLQEDDGMPSRAVQGAADGLAPVAMTVILYRSTIPRQLEVMPSEFL